MGTTHTPPTARTAEDARLRPIVGDTYTNAIGMTFKVIALDDVEVRLRDADGDEWHYWPRTLWSTPCVGGGTWRAAGGDTGPTGDALETACAAFEVARRAVEDAFYAEVERDAATRGVRVEYYPWDGYHAVQAVQAVVVGAFKGTVTVEFNVLARGWRVTSMYSGAWHTTLADAWVAAEAAYAAWGAL